MGRVTPFARFVRSAAVLVALLGLVGLVVHEPRPDDRPLITQDDPDGARRPTAATAAPTSRDDADVSTATEAEGEDPPPPGVDREEAPEPRRGRGDRSVEPPAPGEPSPPASSPAPAAAPVPADGDADPGAPEEGRPAVYAVDPATGRHRLLARGMLPLSTSRDGRLLVLGGATFTGSHGPPQLYRSDGTFLRTLPGGGISFSPDNRRIVYRTRVGEESWTDFLYTFDLTDPNAEPVEILRGPYIVAAEWSPRGDLISFVSDRGTEVIAPDGGGRRLVRQEGFGEWSPDGTRMLFARQTHETNWNAEVFSTDLQGVPSPIASLPQGESVFRARWSPDGRAVSVTSTVSGEISDRLRVFPSTGGPGKDLGPVRADPGWTRDGRHLASFWVEPEDTNWSVTEVVLIAVDGGARRVISRSNCAGMPHERSLDTGEILVGVSQPGAAWGRGPESCKTGPP